MFVGAERTFVDEPRAKATVLMVICKDDGNLSATEERTKRDEHGVEMVLRFLSTYEGCRDQDGWGRACCLDVQERMKVRVIPGTQLLPLMLRHSVWTVVRYQSDQRAKQTPYERTRGCRYGSALVVMAKIADADKMRAGKLDSAWVK